MSKFKYFIIGAILFVFILIMTLIISYATSPKYHPLNLDYDSVEISYVIYEGDGKETETVYEIDDNKLAELKEIILKYEYAEVKQSTLKEPISGDEHIRMYFLNTKTHDILNIFVSNGGVIQTSGGNYPSSLTTNLTKDIKDYAEKAKIDVILFNKIYELLDISK